MFQPVSDSCTDKGGGSTANWPGSDSTQVVESTQEAESTQVVDSTQYAGSSSTQYTVYM